MINISDDMKNTLDSNGHLPKYAWPGGYPLFYTDYDNNTLCPTCANKNDGYNAPIEAYDINYESDLTCDHCAEKIERAYDDPDPEPQEEWTGAEPVGVFTVVANPDGTFYARVMTNHEFNQNDNLHEKDDLTVEQVEKYVQSFGFMWRTPET